MLVRSESKTFFSIFSIFFQFSLNPNPETMNKKIKAPVKQQFTIPKNVDVNLEKLAASLSKSPLDLKREILTACSGIKPSNYWIALSEIQKLSESPD